jgi:hypothetical protein
MKRPNFSLRYAFIITGIAVMAYLVMDFNSRMSELRNLSAQHEQVSAQLALLEGQKSKIETQIAYAGSEEAVYQWAYDQGHLYREGDYPVVPIAPVVSTPAPTPIPVVRHTTVDNWDLWKWLFIDRDAPRLVHTP